MSILSEIDSLNISDQEKASLRAQAVQNSLAKQVDYTTDDKGNKSMIRKALNIIINIVKYLAICAGAVLLYQGYKEMAIDWTGFAAFIGSLGVFMAPVLAAKSHQKGKENERDTN